MYFEEGTIVRTQNWDSPGRYGDSDFDTMAFALSFFYTSPGHEYPQDVNHKKFITPNGTVRHPKSPWGPEDQTEDNEMLLYVFCREVGDQVSQKFIRDQCGDWKTGNGNFISPAYWAEIKDWMWLRCLCQTIQAIFFLFPYWNDGNWKEFKLRIESYVFELSWREKKEHFWDILKQLAYYWPICSPSDRTDGYLKWAIIADDTPWPFRKLIAREKLKQKILYYYWLEIEQMTHIPLTVLVLQTHRKLVDQL